MVASDTGGNEYSKCQIDEPVNPLTTLTPSRWAARAESFISWIAHSVFFLASPRIGGGYPVVGASVVVVEHKLAGQVVRDRPALESVLVRAARGVPCNKSGSVERFLHVEVVAPARQLDAVVTPSARLLGDDFQRQVGPLAGKECRGSCHHAFSQFQF